MLRITAFVAVALAATVSSGNAGQMTSPVLLDPDMTVGAGATVTAAVGQAIAQAEDAIVPDRLFTERGVTRRSANVAYRLLKLAYFDLPQEQWLWVANHEVFGHGARLRERFDGPIGYRVDAPVPYGPGGGSTSFEFDREPTVHELLAVTVAGMEADAVAARLIVERAFITGHIRVRDALRYLGFELDTVGYVLSTGDEPEEPGHDVSDFLEHFNEMAASVRAPALTARTLRREVLASFANPMLGYAVYGIAQYVWRGAADVAVPALSIAGVRYVPMLRYRLAPFGTEWSVVNLLGGRLRTTEVELRFGRSPGATPWGAGVRQREVATWRSWRLDLGLELWRQPRITDNAAPSVAASLRLGAQVLARLERPVMRLWFGSVPATIVADLGAKTAGFVPGEPLRGGIVVRAGVGLPLGR